jgi:hypothetical protein
VGGERAAGQVEHFEGPNDPLQVARLDSTRRLAIHAGEHAVQERDAAPLGDICQSLPERRIAARPREQPPRERAVIETGAAHDERQPATRVHLSNHARGIPGVLGRRVFGCGIDDVDQVMRDTAPIAGGDLVGADVEAPVHRGRVAVDDLTSTRGGQRQRQRALPRSRRPENRDDERTVGRGSRLTHQSAEARTR